MDTLAIARFALLAVAPDWLFAAPVALPPEKPPVAILVPDDAGRWFPEQVDSDDAFAISEWRVIPNPRDLALRPERVIFPLPDGRVLSFDRQRMDYVSGVDLDEDDNLILDPDPRNLS